ncbi:MAG: GNAT family N-acetyltransferase [Firmicutes bacterium]|nr:GNAT family N-acetyltransferase [Bacillota bacterium]
MEYKIENPYGSFKCYYELEKRRVNIIIESCFDVQNLMASIQKQVNEFGLKEAFITSRVTGVFMGTPDYQIVSYSSFKTYEAPKGYTLVPLNESLYQTYIDLTNESTFDVDNMSYADIEEVKEYVEDKECHIGLIEFEGTKVGSYIIKNSELELLAIHKDYQGMGHGKKALQLLLSTIEGEKTLMVATSNKVAISLYVRSGFEKTDKYCSDWYHLIF